MAIDLGGGRRARISPRPKPAAPQVNTALRAAVGATRYVAHPQVVRRSPRHVRRASRPLNNIEIAQRAIRTLPHAKQVKFADYDRHVKFPWYRHVSQGDPVASSKGARPSWTAEIPRYYPGLPADYTTAHLMSLSYLVRLLPRRSPYRTPLVRSIQQVERANTPHPTSDAGHWGYEGI